MAARTLRYFSLPVIFVPGMIHALWVIVKKKEK
jgi:hypothetical protein